MPPVRCTVHTSTNSTGLYQINLLVRYPDDKNGGVIPQVDDVSYMSGGGNAFYSYFGPYPYLPYSTALYLSQDQVLRFLTTSDTSTINFRQFSTHLVGAAPTGFSVRYNTTFACVASGNIFASGSAALRVGYNSGGFSGDICTAESMGAFHFNVLVRFSDGASKTPGIYVTVNDYIVQDGTDRGVILSWQDPSNRHYLPYSVQLPLPTGDQVRVIASAADTVVYAEFSGYLVDGGVPVHIITFPAAIASNYKKAWITSGYTYTQLAPTGASPTPPYLDYLAPNYASIYTTATTAADAVSDGMYMEFSITKASGIFTPTVLEFTGYKTTAATRGWAVRSSADSYASDIATGVISANGIDEVERVPLSGVAFANMTSVSFRIYGYGDTGTTWTGYTNIKLYTSS